MTRPDRTPWGNGLAAAAFAAIFAALGGCAQDSELLEDAVIEQGAFAAELSGRMFHFKMLTAPDDPEPILQIEGDGVFVSFHSSTPPLIATVRGAGVDWGGRRFEATATPNDFRVDGQPHLLPAPGIYIFSDGVFEGQYPFQ